MDTQTIFKGIQGNACLEFHAKVGDMELIRNIMDRSLEKNGTGFLLKDGPCDLTTYTSAPVKVNEGRIEDLVRAQDQYKLPLDLKNYYNDALAYNRYTKVALLLL